MRFVLLSLSGAASGSMLGPRPGMNPPPRPGMSFSGSGSLGGVVMNNSLMPGQPVSTVGKSSSVERKASSVSLNFNFELLVLSTRLIQIVVACWYRLPFGEKYPRYVEHPEVSGAS